MMLRFRASGPTRWGNMVATRAMTSTTLGKAKTATSMAIAATITRASLGRRAAASATANCTKAAAAANTTSQRFGGYVPLRRLTIARRAPTGER